METTLEVRWFFRGMPPAVVRQWFRLECPGKLLTKSEKRKDLYASISQEHLDLLTKFSDRPLSREQINLKLRQGNLELKLKQQFAAYRLSGLKQTCIYEGKVEQWCKISERELRSLALSLNSLREINWIAVNKEREQKIEQGVKSELTWLKCDRQPWWTIAFEMSQNKFDRQQNSHFQNVVEKACQTYPNPQLLATNSYSYSQWLLESVPQTMSNR